MSASPVCGFVGLGSQGAPIARRMLDAGLPLYLWARRPETLAPFQETGAVAASSIEDLATRADHIGICVSDDAAVLEVCNALIPAMRSGARLAVHSTTSPRVCIELAERAASRGIALIEAPVSGGGPGAAAGKLTVMTAGDVEEAQAAHSLFGTFASTIIHLGGYGAAQTAKLINNTLMAANLGLASSAVRLGEAQGLDRDALIRLLQASSGRSYALDVFGRISERGGFSHATTLLDKVRLLGEAGSAGMPAFDVLRNAALALRDGEAT